MATVSPAFDTPAPKAEAPAKPTTRVRDPRLDFFRGCAMFIILIAHTPYNLWARWIPARFGFSDATEIFVFCSGMASAIAFGATFARAGWWMGTARTLYRIWQVYWAHIGLFFAIATTMAAIDLSGWFDESYVASLNLWFFFDDPLSQLVGLATLRYVPNYFDILPMYMVILMMMPFFILLARVSVWLALGVSAALWLVCNLGLLPLPAEPWSNRQWFFNPFGWQLLFFTGFALMAGWLPPPPIRRGLIWAAVAFLVLTLPLSSPHGVSFLKLTWPAAADWAMETYPKIEGVRNKTEFAILRFIHFLSLAYLAWIAVGPRGARLSPEGEGLAARVWQWVVTVTMKVGQQSLAIFVFSMYFARIIGLVLEHTEGTPGMVFLANVVGFGSLIGVAYLVGWVKTHPWRGKKP